MKDGKHHQSAFEQNLFRYADCILDVGVALRRGQYLLVSALTVHRPLVLALAEQAYRRGASYVSILYQDEEVSKLQLELGEDKAVSFIPKGMRAAYEEVIETHGAFIALSGRENLKAFQGIDPDRQSRALLARTARLDFFYQKIYTNQLKWCVAGAATAGIAAMVFPHRELTESLPALWNEIFSICRIHEKEPAAAWRRQAALLEARKQRLNGMRIARLCMKSPTCNLSLRLDKRARWQGGFSITPDGEKFLANIPTEEVFTVPDCRSLTGRFTTSRPFVYKNIFIETLSLEFQEGKIVSLDGSAGVDELRRIIAADPSHGLAGEIALVDSNSAVARSGLVFYDLLFDENAQSHLALGSGYSECLSEIRQLGPAEREQAGFNTSALHIDIMFGSPELTVTAETADGESVTVMENGSFTGE